jgi:large subunit ribosomal protein L21
MFAVVRTGGKQYRVAPGDKIAVEKLDGQAGDTITLSDVLLAGEGDRIAEREVTVSAEIIAQAKGEKIVVFKKRRRHNYRRKNGHRQQLTLLRIVAVGDEKAPVKNAATAASSGKQEPETAAAKDAGDNAQGKAPAKPRATAKKPAKASGMEKAAGSGEPAKAAPKKAAATKKAADKPATHDAAPKATGKDND